MATASVVRERVPLVAGVLSACSLALVFAAVGGAIPRSALPTAPSWLLETIPHINAAISLTAIATIALGWRWIRAGAVDRHRYAMVLAFGLFAAFLFLYLYRLISMGGPNEFPGPDGLARTAYLLILATHILLAMVCIPLLYYVLLLATTRSVGELRRTRHAAVGRVAAALWLVSFGLGVVVYAILYHVY